MKTVIDIDDTLAVFVSDVVEKINSMFQKTIDTRDCGINWMSMVIAEHEWDQLRPHVYNEPFFAGLKLKHSLNDILGLFEYLDAWTFVTARHAPLGNDAHRVTREWLIKQGIPLGREIIICHHAESKLPYFPTDTQLVIEDSAHVAQEADAAGLIVMLIDQPWNRHVSLKNKYSQRVLSLVEAKHAVSYASYEMQRQASRPK